MKEHERIKSLFSDLIKVRKKTFPLSGQKLNVPTDQGVYIIYHKRKVLHVGRTLRAAKGIKQRLKNHLYGSSSFAKKYLKKKEINLRDHEISFKYLIVPNSRNRALLESLTIGRLCPEHLGLGENDNTTD